ncbi:hypothetical protein GCM10009581_23550 [Tsukamurella strandjordii]
MSKLLGKELMPWQLRAAEVITEIDPATGRYTYPNVVITVPRQSGKTALVLVLAMHRAMTGIRQQIWYTAQDAQAARRRFLEDLAEPAEDPAVTDPALIPHLDLKKGAGDTKLIVKQLHSTIRPFTPSAKFAHGDKHDLTILDECWEYDESKATTLMQAVGPTQQTRKRPQTIYLSTAGDARSTWWQSLVDKARSGAPGWAIIDYGIAEDVNPSDIDAVIEAHPAVGYTTPAQAIRDAATTNTPSEFARAYGNRPTLARESILTAEQLDRLFTAEPILDGAPFALAAATSFDRTETAVVVAALDHAGHPLVEVLDVRPGTAWAVDLIRAVRAARNPVATVVDPNSPSAVIADQLNAADPEMLLPVTARELSTATDDMLRRAGLRTPEIRFRFHDSMRRSWEFATLRHIAETGRMWSRKHSTGSIAALEAATLALHGLTHQPPAIEPAYSRIA